MKNILYVHGFLSSPQSAKARQLQVWATEHAGLRIHVPALPLDPVAALAVLETAVRGCDSPPGLIGSSLGGFYANILAARHGLRAVLVNPAVHPHLLLAQHLGTTRNHHTGETAELTPAHVAVLEQLETPPAHPERLWVLLETGDETLDYRQAERFYAACTVDVKDGGSHFYDGFVERLPAIVEFLSQ